MLNQTNKVCEISNYYLIYLHRIKLESVNNSELVGIDVFIVLILGYLK